MAENKTEIRFLKLSSSFLKKKKKLINKNAASSNIEEHQMKSSLD